MRVLLVVIDAASPRVVCPAVQTGLLPNLNRLADAGRMHQASVTIFPSITPAATASIVTGCYPAEHGIAGAAWFDDAREEVAYYGDDFWVVAAKGFGAFLRDFLAQLNGERLTAPTLFEMVERTGRTACSVNYLVYRGLVPHTVRVPRLMTLLPGVPVTASVDGPSMLGLGDFVGTFPHPAAAHRRGLRHRFGMDDESSGAMLAELVARGPLPDLTVAYFADNDFRSHEVGPSAALPVIGRVDAALGAAFDAAGGFERLLRDTTVIVTSDHGHCEILPDAARAVIRLDEVLGDFHRADLARGWRGRDEVLVCPNMRAAQIYLRRPSSAMVQRVARALLAEPRVDLVLWPRPAEGGADGYVVESGRGRLEFGRARDGGAAARDAFGSGWWWRGDMSALQLVGSDGRFGSVEYPNALERIAGALDARNSGQIWATARPGCEFEARGSAAHVGGGSHGALHALDSLSPLIIGGPDPPALPRDIRSVDIAPLCMELLDLPMRYSVGDPRA